MNPTQALKNRTARLVAEATRPVFTSESSDQKKEK